jgi:hypothetical protein
MRVPLGRILTHRAVPGSPGTLSELYERLSGRVNRTFSVGEYSKKLGCVSSKTVTKHSRSIISLTCAACQVEETTQGLTLSQYTGCQHIHKCSWKSCLLLCIIDLCCRQIRMYGQKHTHAVGNSVDYFILYINVAPGMR